MSGSTKAGYSVTISATDAATGTIDKINKRLAEIRRPTEQMNRSLQKFSEVTGLDKIGKDFDQMGRYALQGADALGRMVPGLSAITGAATVAGLGALAVNMGGLAQSLQNVADRIGLAAPQLLAIENALKRVGGTAGEADASLIALKDHMVNAAAGRDGDFLLWMHNLGLSLKDLTGPDGKLLPAADAMLILSRAIAKLKDPALAAAAAQHTLGDSSAAMLEFLRQGPDAIKAQEQAQARLLGVTQDMIDKNAAFGKSVTDLENALKGASIRIGATIGGALSGYVEDVAKAIGANNDMVANIGLGIGAFAGLTTAIGLTAKGLKLLWGLTPPAWFFAMLARAAPLLLTGPAGEVDPSSRFDQTGHPRTPTGPDPFTGLLPGAEPPLPSTWGRGFHAADLWRRYSPTTDPRLDPQSYPPNYDPSAWRGDRPRAQFIRDDWLDPRDGKGRDLTTPADKQTAESKRAAPSSAELARSERQGEEVGRGFLSWLSDHQDQIQVAIGGTPAGTGARRPYGTGTIASGGPAATSAPGVPASTDDVPGAASREAEAADIALQHLGERPAQIGAWLAKNTGHLDAAQHAWCAEFVNSALRSVGITGTGSAIATSFSKWGRAVNPGDLRRGDVMLESHGHGAGETGGHVGLLTGRFRNGGKEAEMISGNRNGQVSLSWEPTAGAEFRRATQAAAAAAAAAGIPVTPAATGHGALGNLYHNPFNLDVGPSGNGAIAGHTYTDPHDHRPHTMGEYSSTAEGIAAAYRRLQHYQAEGFTTIHGMIDRWTGSSSNYGAALARELGVGFDAPVDLGNRDFARRFLEAMKPHENPGALNDMDVRRGLGMDAPAPDLHAGRGLGSEGAPKAHLSITVDDPKGLTSLKLTSSGKWHAPPQLHRAMPSRSIV